MSRCRAGIGLGLALSAVLLVAQVQAAGSWVATAPSVRVAMVDRPAHSAPLTTSSPALAQGQWIGRVSWQYRLPPGGEVQAWLCHPGHCVALSGPRGQTEALAGLPADAPLHFRFALRDQRQRALTLQGLQVIVNHEPPDMNRTTPPGRE
ncbi:flagellar FlhE [Halomonas campisalis]|uniref:Flagellar FlhE n=1 Tax=Billgrantia campisalis TaxID=74661 RepID=A0ABS9P336_9GAMM|nr:flagellar protein FlhE [Halomonas campisalis]MCG6656198.1 flagellar FlhE [Halomonas campisalis]MDR5861384.1 flagellar protein FlhE [Halomonas campisalis]